MAKVDQKVMHYWWLWILGIIVLGLGFVFYHQSQGKPQDSHQNNNKETLVLVPGTTADSRAFDGTLAKMGFASTEIEKLQVDVNNQVKVLNKVKNPKAVVIAFDNAQDGPDNIGKQSQYLSNGLDYLLKEQGINQVRFVGHSNGGLVITDYLLHHLLEKQKVLGLFLIATPFDGLVNVSAEDETAWNTYYESLKVDAVKKPLNYPTTLVMARLNGDLDNDGAVPMSSVKAGKILYPKAKVKEIVNEDHVGVLTDPDVITMLQEFANPQAQATIRSLNANADSQSNH